MDITRFTAQGGTGKYKFSLPRYPQKYFESSLPWWAQRILSPFAQRSYWANRLWQRFGTWETEWVPQKLPTGVNLTPDGRLRSTGKLGPVAVGTYDLMFTVEDSGDQSGS